jgi:ornithine cyclodeaminase/alanine dehydrogenase-like protein (mu-crystallin family)
VTTSAQSLRTFSPKEIKAALGIKDALEPVAESLSAFSQGRALKSPPGLMTFPNGGEAHIKSGYISGYPYFVTKIATMVPANRRKGLHTSDGVMLLCSADTGFPVAMLHDRKYLTDIRTAAVGALAARLMAPLTIGTVGVFGTGGQANLQVEALSLVRSFKRVLVWGRDRTRAEKTASIISSKLPACRVNIDDCAQRVTEQSQVLITATAATEAFIKGAWLQPGTHITAVGADDAHKCELDWECFERATFIATDSRDLAARFGEIARHGFPLIDRVGKPIPELGEMLAGQRLYCRAPDDITISKHIGLGVEDLAIASECFSRLAMEPTSLQRAT